MLDDNPIFNVLVDRYRGDDDEAPATQERRICELIADHRNTICSVYVLHAPELRRVKIGRSIRSAAERIRAITANCAATLETIAVFRSDSIVEGTLHEIFAGQRLHGEWFTVDDAMERFFHIARAAEELDKIPQPQGRTLGQRVYNSSRGRRR